MKHVTRIGFLVLIAALGFAAPAAHADSYHHDRDHTDHNRGRAEWNHGNRFNGDDHGAWGDRRYYSPRTVTIAHRDRYIITNYYENAHWRPIPARFTRHYLIGAPLPGAIAYYPVPPLLVAQLRPVPREYRYVRVDNDVLLIALATRTVLDAFTLG